MSPGPSHCHYGWRLLKKWAGILALTNSWDELLPDHSSLSKIRSRYGVEAFQHFFERIVELCMEAGLVEGEELYFDATSVEADASMDSLRPRLSLAATREHVRMVFKENPAPGEGPPTPPDPPDPGDAGG